jgi:hypothetical protein
MSEEYTDVRSLAVDIALVEAAKGVKESGGQNRGKEIDVYLKNAHSPLDKGYGWCGMFIYYCYSQAANMVGKTLPFSAYKLWSGQKLKNWSLSYPDKIVNTSPVLRGDIYVMNSYHIGMVVEDMTDAYIMKTVDGNQSFSDSGKESLRVRTRNFADMRLIIRI